MNQEIQPPSPEYGNTDINNMLKALKQRSSIAAFVDSKIERMMARHCLNLMNKIGKDEFVKRYDLLLKDNFTRKHCNKIKFIYNNIKGYIAPQSTSLRIEE